MPFLFSIPKECAARHLWRSSRGLGKVSPTSVCEGRQKPEWSKNRKLVQVCTARQIVAKQV